VHPAFTRTDHRPWPVPGEDWTWQQTWCDLLFAHWRVPAAVLRPHVPPALTLQEFDGSAWLGVVPFRIEGATARHVPAVPVLSDFPELNVRTYVDHDGRPGVWFFSLDTTRTLAVLGARAFFHLPYYRASMQVDPVDGGFRYRSNREERPPADLFMSYAPTGAAFEARPGTLDHFLTERYCLYATSSDGSLFITEIHHVPWPLQPAEARIETNTMGTQVGLALDGAPATLHFTRRQEVVIWNPERLR
jgi:uncharacterized protein YqjF (DUF2071 family)